MVANSAARSELALPSFPRALPSTMTIQWMFVPAAPVHGTTGINIRSKHGDDSDQDPTTAHCSALVDLVPSVLACLDYESIRQLSGVCRAASQSHVRAYVLERSVVQLSPTSVSVHDMLRRMVLRPHVQRLEIRDCRTRPYAIPDLVQLLAYVQRVKFTDAPTLDREVLDEVNGKRRESSATKMDQKTYMRHVRRRLDEQHRSMYHRDFPDNSPEVAREILPWFLALNPAALVEVDFGALLIDDFQWLRLFPSLKKLQFNGASIVVMDDFLAPLAWATSLEELVITRLELRTCPELTALPSLRSLELRCAPFLTNVDFLRNLTKLERLVLTEMSVTDLSPLLHLSALRDLVLDSIESPSVALLGDAAASSAEQHTQPAFPHLESLQIVFTHVAMDRLLRHCPKLTQLHLCMVTLDDWRPFTTLDQLTQVSINIDGIHDWTALAGLDHLKRFALDSRHGSVDSQHFGTGWKALEEVISPPWDDYTPLVRGAPSLRLLQLLGWRSRDSSSLAALKHAAKLRTLWIALLPGPVELSTVGELHQLRSLELWNASVVTIDFLRGMKNLIELKLGSPFRDGVDIINFTPLGQLTNLQTLVLNGRREFKNATLGILNELPKLKNLDVSDTGVTPLFLKKLKVRYNTEASTFQSGSERSRLARSLGMS